MIDTHCHLDAQSFQADRSEVIERAWQAGLQCLIVPAVMPSTFEDVRSTILECQNFSKLKMSQGQHGLIAAYALGTHPLYIHQVGDNASQMLYDALGQWRDDPFLVAVGEIGLDHFVPLLQNADSLIKQERLLIEQLEIAVAFDLPVILHVRKSVDALITQIKRFKKQGKPVSGGIAHAFNGSLQQAHSLLDLGFKLGFGGTLTFERALKIRSLAKQLPNDAIVLETDAPDIPPSWRYQTAQARAEGIPMPRNEPFELIRISQTLADLRGWDQATTCQITKINTCQALPRLTQLLV